MIGCDSELIQLMDELTRHQSSRQIISIVGMGGMGKTTLARNVYDNLLIVESFDIRAWVTVAQKTRREIILQLLSCQGKQENNETDKKTEDQLGEQLYKSLYGRRYLIVMDDTWSIGDWEKIKTFIPKNDNRSRILVTTRQSDVANGYGSSSCFQMKFLDQDKSWELFCDKAFGKAICPPELEEIGKQIVGKCRGLPLSISVIGGLLGKSSMTQQYWENVAENLNYFLSSGKDAQCSDILSLSYSHLPIHLKPCFLYMGIFPEDHEIRVSQLIKLWVAEGFLKPNKSQSLEETAEDYLKDLIDRNLVLIHGLGSNGNVKSCNIHDLIRDLCIRIAMKENFLCVMRKGIDIPCGVERERRIVLDGSNEPRFFNSLQSTSLVRSLVCDGSSITTSKVRLLRVMTVSTDKNSLKGIFSQLVNLRYLACAKPTSKRFFLSISQMWNVQTLNLGSGYHQFVAPSQIWEMPQLRHVVCEDLSLVDPASSGRVKMSVLGNLRTLMKVSNLRLSENVCTRIPNVKKLHLRYDEDFWKMSEEYYCFQNIACLHKLEYLKCALRMTNIQSLAFPISLKKLSLFYLKIDWEDMTIIGLLPLLEVLKLELISCGPEWNPVEGQFLRLKFLRLGDASNLRYWNAEGSHFPVLERLILDRLNNLDEINLSIGDIPTLRLIQLDRCSESAAISAVRILEEQESLGNEGLKVGVKFENKEDMERFKEEVGLDNFNSNNLKFEYMYT